MANDANLKPFKKGQSGNPKGKPKGIQSWSTLVRKLLADEKIAPKLLKKQPDWWNHLPQKNAGNAIVIAMVIQAMSGSEKAATWLRRTGYGDKLDITSDDKPVKTVSIFSMRPEVPVIPVKVKSKPKTVPKPKVAKPAVKKPAPKKAK